MVFNSFQFSSSVLYSTVNTCSRLLNLFFYHYVQLLIDRGGQDEKPMGIGNFITTRLKMISSIMSFLQDPSPYRVRRSSQVAHSLFFKGPWRCNIWHCSCTNVVLAAWFIYIPTSSISGHWFICQIISYHCPGANDCKYVALHHIYGLLYTVKLLVEAL